MASPDQILLPGTLMSRIDLLRNNTRFAATETKLAHEEGSVCLPRREGEVLSVQLKRLILNTTSWSSVVTTHSDHSFAKK